MRYFWAFVVAVVLFTLGGLFSVYEGYHKIRDPHEIDSPAVAIGDPRRRVRVRGASRCARRSATRRRSAGSAAGARYIRESRSPELPVLLLEDSGALIGLSFALLGVAARADHRRAGLRRHRHARRSACCCSRIAVVLAREMRSLLIGEAASPELERTIEAEFERARRACAA